MPFLFLICLLTSAIAEAAYITKDVTGNYEDDSSWEGGTSPGDNAYIALDIYGNITKSSDLTVYYGVNIYGSLTIEGALTVNSNTIYVYEEGNLTVTEDFNLNVGLDVKGTVTIEGSLIGGNGITVEDGGTLIIYGDVETSQSITVKEGGTLIIYGDLTSSHSLTVEGNVVILGDYNCNAGATINASGNLVISGDLNVTSNWGFNVDGDNADNIYLIGEDSEVNIPSYYSYLDIYSGGTGDYEDLLENESDNAALLEVLADLGLVEVAKLPFTEDFEDSSYEDYWTLGSTNNNKWYVGTATAYNSSYSAYVSDDNGANASYSKENNDINLELKVDLRGFSSVDLSFWYRSRGYNNNAYGTLYFNNVKLSTSNYYNTNNWTKVSLEDLTNTSYLGQIATLKFIWNNATSGQQNDPGFCVDDVNLTGTLESPTGFSAIASTEESNSDINLTWTANSVNDTVIIVSSFSTISVSPTIGTIYSVGDELIDGVSVIFKGTSEELSNTPLKYGTTYYYKAWSTRNGLYSATDGVAASATTNTKASSKVALIETWGDSDDDTGVTWYGYSTGSDEQDESDYWMIDGDDQSADNSGHSAYITYDEWTGSDWRRDYPGGSYYYHTWTSANQGADYNIVGSTSIVRTLYCTIDLSSFGEDDACNLIFDWLCKGYVSYNADDNDAYGLVYILPEGQTEATDDDYFGGIVTEGHRYYNADEWQSELFDMSKYYGQKVKLVFEWHNSRQADANHNYTQLNPPSFCVDNIKVTSASSSVSIINAAENISSVVNSSADALSDDAGKVFDVTFSDKSTGVTNPTNIRQFTVSQGSSNATSLSDWTNGIAGAALYYNGSIVATGTVYSSKITFTPGTELTIPNGEDKTYQLYIWLEKDLNENDINDGDAFDFAITTDDIITGEGDDFIENQSVSSGTVPIDVVATALDFTTEPSSTAVYDEVLYAVPVVSAVDANGNIDTDATGTVSLSIGENSNAVSVTLSTTSVTLSSGSGTFSNLKFSGSLGTTITLNATYGSIEEESDEVAIYEKVVNNTFSTFYINRVIFGDAIDNSAQGTGLSSDGYELYADKSATVERSQSYDISLTVRNAYYITEVQYDWRGNPSGYTNVYDQTGYAYVWIDWDQSGTFDSDEKTTIGSFDSKKENGGQRTTTFSNISVSVPSDAKSGSTIMRVVFTTLSGLTDYESATGSNEVAEAEDYTMVVKVEEQKWLGKTSVWNLTTNWSLGTIPTLVSDVTIPEVPTGGKFPVISSSAVTNNLTVEKGASCTVAAGASLTVNGDLVTHDSLIISNIQNASGDIYPASFIVYGDVSGDVKEDWELTYDVWWYIAHPINGDLIPDYKESLGSGNYYLYVYNNTSLAWSKITSYSSYDFSATQAIAVGILKDGYTLSYSGTLNNEDDYIYTAQTEGYQNIGNPYPSYIDFDAICTSTNSTITQKTEEYDNNTVTGYTSYIYTTYNNVRQYATYNTSAGYGLNSGSKYIAPGQCFWVYASAGEKVEITKDACTNSATGSVSLKSTGSSDSNEIIKLALVNSNTYDEILIVGDENNGSDDFTKYDSKKWKNSGVIGNIYTVKNSIDIAINSLPEFYNGQVIPMGYSVSSSGMTDFTIKVSNLSNVDDFDIYLYDKDKGDSINLKTTTEYSFTPLVASSDERFQIKIYSIETESGSDETTTDIGVTYSDEVAVYTSSNTAYVSVSEEWLNSSTRMINVYNVAGQLVQQVELNDLETSFKLPDTAVYIVKVVSGDKVYTQKVFGE